MLLLGTACDPGVGYRDPCIDGHNFNVTITATCLAAGQEVRECTRCQYTVSTAAAALGHMAAISAEPATCETAGNTGIGTCLHCEASITGSVIPALGHDHFESLVCKNTGCNHRYYLGQEGPGGGFIFYVADGIDGRNPFRLYMNAADNTGILAHYLEAAPSDMSGTLRWASRDGDAIPNLSQNSSDVTDWAIGRGRMNTAIIIAHGNANSYTTPAASACVAPYNAGGSITDWFLPNKDELAQLRIFHVAANAGDYPGLNTGLTNNEYFSSSQYSHASGWRQDFSDGGQNYSSKINARNVRAIRAF